MPIGSTPLTLAIMAMLGTLLFIAGGLRFRRWAIDDRPGIPRYSHLVETVLLWLVYSGAVSVAIIVFRQTLRQL